MYEQFFLLMWSVRFEIQMIEMTDAGPHAELAISGPYCPIWPVQLQTLVIRQAKRDS